MVSSLFYNQMAKACHGLADIGVKRHQIGLWLDTQEAMNGDKDAAAKAKLVCQAMLWDGHSLDEVSQKFGVPADAASRIVMRECRRLGVL